MFLMLSCDFLSFLDDCSKNSAWLPPRALRPKNLLAAHVCLWLFKNCYSELSVIDESFILVNDKRFVIVTISNTITSRYICVSGVKCRFFTKSMINCGTLAPKLIFLQMEAKSDIEIMQHYLWVKLVRNMLPGKFCWEHFLGNIMFGDIFLRNHNMLGIFF